MLSDVCRYLNNWFDSERLFGEFTIADGNITGLEDKLQTGQYFRIIESVFNDGIHQYPATDLQDETFTGAVWVLKIPPEVVAISEEIDVWNVKNATADSAAMSPFQSESFGGYSYTKASGSDGSEGGGAWQSVPGFTSRLNGWRKVRCRY